MPRATSAPAQPIPIWMIALLLALLALRLPAFLDPAGSDQSLYLYIGQRLLDGGVPYVDAWDQKPPAVYAIYAALWTIWPHESVVALADLIAAGATAWLLVAIGRRRFGAVTGAWAAALFLLFSHPALVSRLGGVYVRGQCEVLISVAIAAALFVLAHPRRTLVRSLLAGLWLGAAIWIKFNAVAYVLPLAVAAWYWDRSGRDVSTWLKDLIVIATGVVLVSTIVLLYFAAHNAIDALTLATIDYNLRYAGDTYASRWAPLQYLASLPLARAKVDVLWFFGGAGLVGLLLAGRGERDARAVTFAWIAAALVSIGINGARELPQYFVQAAPALACAAALGAAAWLDGGALQRYTVLAVVVAGLWRVGVEPVPVRLGGLTELANSVALDLSYLRGRIGRDAFLSRFVGQQKYNAPEVDALTTLVRTTTTERDRILVFGFSPAVYVFGGRRSASRFFWSRPVVIEFASEHRGYGSVGLLDELRQQPPALVALQKQDWGGINGEPNSYDFFMAETRLKLWLEAGYTRESESPMFSVWRRKP